MARDNLYPHLWRAVAAAAERRREAWARLADPAAVGRRQAWIRETVTRLIGGLPARQPLRAETTRVLERDGYRLELVVFWSRPGVPVTGTLYLPTNAGPGPHPAVLEPCGHSANGRLYGEYQRVALGLVRQGFVVFCHDPLSQGERVQYLDAAGRRRLRGCCDEHCMVGNQLNLVGSNFAAYRVWDGLRAMDYLCERPEVDASRVAVTGNSGGGTLTSYLLCLDERFAAGAPSCYITTLVHRIASRMCADSEQQFVGQLAEGIDHADLLLPLAPKPLLICAAERDFFPIEGTRRTVDELRAVYQVLGAGERIDLAVVDSEHAFSRGLREAMVRWFRRHLQGLDEPYEEPELPVEEDATLYAVPDGQVLRAVPGARPIHAVVRDEWRPTPRVREAADPAALVRETLPRLLGIDPSAARRPWPLPAAAAEPLPPIPVPAGLRAERIAFLSDPDVRLDAVLIAPASPAGTVVLVPDVAGGAALRGEAIRLADGGEAVLVVDPRGIGEGLGPPPAGFAPGHHYDVYGLEVEMTYTSWMLGRPLLGQRVVDVLCAVELAARRGGGVRLEGHGTGGLLALLAAALDPRVAGVAARRAPAGWGPLFEAETYRWLPDIFLPDVLRWLDLPDVIAAIAPRPVLIDSPLGADREPLTAAVLESYHAPATAAYRTLGVPERLTLRAGIDEKLT